jgi:hemerythrin superfamily protein
MMESYIGVNECKLNIDPHQFSSTLMALCLHFSLSVHTIGEFMRTIYDMLSEDHDEVQALFSKLLALNDKDEQRADIVDQIYKALIPHSRSEEAVFYNTLRSIGAGKGKVFHGFAEHMEAEVMLKALIVEIKTGLPWKATAKKLSSALDHHIKEEETKIFALGREALTVQEAEAIGDAFLDLKAKVAEGGELKNMAQHMKNMLPPSLTDKFTSIQS